MRLVLASCFAALAASTSIAACSGDSSPSGATDAGSDAPSVDAGREASCPFGCAHDGGTDDADAALTCTQLKALIGQLQSRATACNPNGAMECSGQTMGICCPISVSPGNTSAIEDFDHAVAAYNATCQVDGGCAMTMCGTNVPSNACDTPMGASSGICQ